MSAGKDEMGLATLVQAFKVTEPHLASSCLFLPLARVVAPCVTSGQQKEKEYRKKIRAGTGRPGDSVGNLETL